MAKRRERLAEKRRRPPPLMQTAEASPDGQLDGWPEVRAAVVALAVAEPRKGGPSILDRAAAAILTPSPQQILYERITFRPSGFVNVPQGPTVHIRAWVDGARPRNFRIRTDRPSGKPFSPDG